MNDITYITNSFRGANEHNARHMETICASLAEAGDHLSESLLGDFKVICAGDGQSAMLANYLCQMLMTRYEQPRPGLPAISLSNSGNTLLALSDEEGFNNAYATQIRALGRPGDVLVLFFQQGLGAQLTQACATARSCDMRVIGIGQDDSAGDDISNALDVWVEIDALSRARCVELQVLCLHALCEQVEQRIFGYGE